MKQERLAELFNRYIQGNYSDAEEAEFFRLWMEPGLQREKEQLFDQFFETLQDNDDMTEEDSEILFQEIIQRKAPVRSLIWKRIAVAASILLVVGIGSYVMLINKGTQQHEIVEAKQERFKNDVNPGGYKARLTLADGSVVILDSVVNGELAKQGGTVVMNKNGQLVYDAKNKSNAVLYNTLSTNRGETYATVLADGSKVWLNSTSSIKYPVAFNGHERRVEITGEAYFEVKHNEAMPFIVSVNGMEVHDLGTEFNINAYTDESLIKTTLVNGSAEVVKGNSKQLLAPGQQAKLTNGSGTIELVTAADVEVATAWRNGRFLFKGTDIQTLMRQLTRWYDVEVQYETIPSIGFNAKISRDIPLSSILKALELTGEVKFRIEGKKVTVIK